MNKIGFKIIFLDILFHNFLMEYRNSIIFKLKRKKTNQNNSGMRSPASGIINRWIRQNGSRLIGGNSEQSGDWVGRGSQLQEAFLDLSDFARIS